MTNVRIRTAFLIHNGILISNLGIFQIISVLLTTHAFAIRFYVPLAEDNRPLYSSLSGNDRKIFLAGSKPTEDETPSLGTRDIKSQELSSSQQRAANPGRDPAHVIDVSSSYRRRPIRDRVQSSPHKMPPMNDMESPPLPRQRTRAKSSVALSSSSNRGPNLDQRQTSAEHTRTAPRRTVPNSLARRPLDSQMQEVIPEGFKFRLLVVGKRQSGKSTLIKTVFKVDASATAGSNTRGGSGINVEFRPEDNRYLVVHECSGFGSQAEDSQNLRTIRDFISFRTDQSCPPSERLHAVWICIPASDAITGRFGEGVEEILGMNNVPVILVLTKFDAVVSEVLFDIARGDVLQYERARATARAMCKVSLRRRFDRDPTDVPAEIVSAEPIYADLIEKLVVTTDGFVLGSRRPSTGFGVPGERSRVSAVPLAWSAALRVCHSILLQTSIEVGRSKYWRRLWSSVNFDDHPLKSCVNIIHVDLVEIWNLNDKTGYLSSDGFKATMSHLVGDLVGYDRGPYPSVTEVGFANWVHGVYGGSQENVRGIMAYIKHLTVIFDAIFSTISGNISQENVQLVIDWHVRSGKKDKIHRKIRGFVGEAFDIGFSARHQDLILERIIDLIQEFCVPDTVNG
ncbi:hypothetical protein V8E53_006288 [Lactarius tabidus]